MIILKLLIIIRWPIVLKLFLEEEPKINYLKVIPMTNRLIKSSQNLLNNKQKLKKKMIKKKIKKRKKMKIKSLSNKPKEAKRKI